MLLALLVSISFAAEKVVQQNTSAKLPLELESIMKQLETESDVKRRIDLSQKASKIYFSRFPKDKLTTVENAIGEGFAFCVRAAKIGDCRQKFVNSLAKHSTNMDPGILHSRILWFMSLGASTELNVLIKKQLFAKNSKVKRDDLLFLGLKYVSELISQMNYDEAFAINKLLGKQFAAELASNRNNKIWQQANMKYIYFAFGNVKQAMKLADGNVPPISACKQSDFDIRKGSQIYSSALDSLMAGNIQAARPFLESCHVVFSGLLATKNMADLSRWVDYNAAMMMTLTGKWSGAGKLLERFEKSLPKGDLVKRAWRQVGDICIHHKSLNKKMAASAIKRLKSQMKGNQAIYGKRWPRFVANVEMALSGKDVNFGKANHLKYCFIKG